MIGDGAMQLLIENTGEIKNDPKPSDMPLPSSFYTPLQSSDRASLSAGHEKCMGTSISIQSRLVSSYQEELTRSIYSLNAQPKSIILSLSNSLTKEFQQQQSVFSTYQGHLRCTYHALSILSKQGWIDNSNMEDHFINVTIIKSMQRVGLDTEYTTSSQVILDNQTQYSVEVFKMYNKLFETIDSRKRQLILLEGNAGTGKTTLAYKVCKEWAEGNVLLQYSHIILLQLRDIKSGIITKPEQLFGAMGNLNQKIYAEMAAKFGSGVLLWLEG